MTGGIPPEWAMVSVMFVDTLRNASRTALA